MSRLGLSRPMALILFTVFLDLLGIGLIFPIGPFYATAFGASAFDVGLLFTLFSVAQFMTIPILGALSDRYGRRPVLLIGVAGEVVGYLLFGTATSLSMLYVSRAGGRRVVGQYRRGAGLYRRHQHARASAPTASACWARRSASASCSARPWAASWDSTTCASRRSPRPSLVVVNWITIFVWLPESLPLDRRSNAR